MSTPTPTPTRRHRQRKRWRRVSTPSILGIPPSQNPTPRRNRHNARGVRAMIRRPQGRRRHHKRCGAGRGSTQGIAEKRGARRGLCPLVQQTCGVELQFAASKNKKSTKILLTENDSRKILLVRQQLPSQRTFQRSSPIRTPEKQSARSTGVRTIRKRDELVRNGSGSHSLQDMWSRSIPDAHRELPPLRALIASALGVPDSSTGTSGGSSR